MFDYKQYKRNYFMPPEVCMDWAKKEYVDKIIASNTKNEGVNKNE